MATPPTGAAIAMIVVLTLDWPSAFCMPLVDSGVFCNSATEAAASDPVELGGAVEVSSVVGLSDGVAKGAGAELTEASGGRFAVPVDDMREETDSSSEVEVDSVVGAGVEIVDDELTVAGADEGVVAAGAAVSATVGVVLAEEDSSVDDDDDDDEDVAPPRSPPKFGSPTESARPPSEFSVEGAGVAAAPSDTEEDGLAPALFVVPSVAPS